MKRIKTVLLTTSIVLVAFLNGCSPKIYTSKYSKEPIVQLAKDVSSLQTQGDITVELKPLDVNKEYEKSFYNQPINVTYIPKLGTTPVTEGRDNIIKLFYNRVPFTVTITNNTDHILRMGESRVVFIDPTTEEPIMAISGVEQELYTDIKSFFPIYNELLAYWQKAYPLTNTLDGDLKLGIMNIIQKIKFINGFNTEIMPGMKFSGILLFPVNTEKIKEGKISFIDMISKVDATGKPTLKVRFDYQTKLTYNYYKTDPNTNNNWVKISLEDFNKGISTPDNYYYDKTQKKWVLGAPTKK